MDYNTDRIVRIPLPLDLIRQMDGLVVQQRGGFQTRAEFIREAVEAMVLELKYEEAPGVLGPAESSELMDACFEGRDRIPAGEIGDVKQKAGSRLGFSALDPKPWINDVSVLANGDASVVDEPMFGLHNRDYPSLWAACRIAFETRRGPGPVEEVYSRVLRDAWELGSRLSEFDSDSVLKASALFPKNREKPESAAAGFFAFALGTYSVQAETISAAGPLYQWGVCQLKHKGKTPMIGVTQPGRDLLMALDGISAETPHSKEHAQAFLDHLRRFASKDAWGLQLVTELAVDGIDRQSLVAQLMRLMPTWKKGVAATNAAGYVARAREWGLLEAKLVEGLYRATERGRMLIERNEAA